MNVRHVFKVILTKDLIAAAAVFSETILLNYYLLF